MESLQGTPAPGPLLECSGANYVFIINERRGGVRRGERGVTNKRGWVNGTILRREGELSKAREGGRPHTGEAKIIDGCCGIHHDDGETIVFCADAEGRYSINNLAIG
jgi:hypothetical protein